MRLLTLDHAGLTKLLENYEKDVVAIKKSALMMSWHMRGGVSYEDVLNMSALERKQIDEIIEHNMEVTKKSQMPYF